MAAPRRSAAALLLLVACGDEALLHGLDESQANQVLVALGDAGLRARASREEGTEAALAVSVPQAEAALARRVLSARDLPRTRAPGFSELFGKPALVPTPVEERARYLLALQGELSRTLETLDGVVAARVHLALPVPDPLRPGPPRPPRAAVLLRCRASSCARLDGLSQGLRQLVAGAAEGLEPSAVSVVVAEAAAEPAAPAPESRPSRWLLGLAAGALAAAAGVVAFGSIRSSRRPAP